MSEHLSKVQFFEVGDLIQALCSGRSDRFFQVYNELMKLYPGLSFDTANKVAEEVVKYESKEVK